MDDFKVKFPNYDVTENGVVYKDGKELHAFNSNGYKQVLLFDINHKRHIFGVHTLVAIKYLDFFEGCIVHHKDRNRSNNSVENLQVFSKSEHARHHSNGRLGEYVKKYGSPRKGVKLSEETKQKIREKALNKPHEFRGNQFVDKYGNRKIGV